MKEPILENQPEKIDNELEKLNFDDLKNLAAEVKELSANTFKRIENGFENINGDRVTIIQDGGVYQIMELSPVFKNFHSYITTENQTLDRGHSDNKVMLDEIEKMIIEFDGRIIE